MNWKKEAANDLRTYLQRKQACENIRQRIKILDEQFVSLKGMSTDTPVKGGISRQEEKMLDNISERERLEFSLKVAQSLIELTERGLANLDETERAVLEGFYFEQIENRVEKLCERFSVEKSTLYRIKDSALEKFTRSEYGIIEL